MTKIAILDDYQNAALKSADWQSLSGADIKVFNYFIEPENRIDALKSFDIIVLMRERTPFPKSLIQHLPNLKLLVTAGLRNLSIDMNATLRQPYQALTTLPFPLRSKEFGHNLPVKQNLLILLKFYPLNILPNTVNRTCKITSSFVSILFFCFIVFWKSNDFLQMHKSCQRARIMPFLNFF